MEITPPRSRPPIPSGPSTQQQKLRSNASENDPSGINRSREAEKRVEEAQREAEARLNHVRDTYRQQIEHEDDRNEHALHTERNKGYEALRNLQRAQQAELSKVKREGEAELARVRNYYQASIDSAQNRGQEEFDSLQKQTSQQLQYEKDLTKHSIDEVKKQSAAQFQQTKELNDRKVKEITEISLGTQQRMQAQATESSERSEQHYRTKFEEQQKQQNAILGDIREHAGAKIREIRRDTAAKLAAYASRQADPFYKMVDIGAELQDEGDHFVLTAKIPEHEQKHVAVSIKGDHIVISGYRRNEEKVEFGPGRTQGTATYQSYHESFPLPAPVEAKKLTREYDGDELIVNIPKKAYSASYKPHQAKKQIERARVEGPKFPESLPHVSNLKEKERDPDEEPRSTRKTISSRTLT